jgi:hypothetical protein
VEIPSEGGGIRLIAHWYSHRLYETYLYITGFRFSRLRVVAIIYYILIKHLFITQRVLVYFGFHEDTYMILVCFGFYEDTYTILVCFGFHEYINDFCICP